MPTTLEVLSLLCLTSSQQVPPLAAPLFRLVGCAVLNLTSTQQTFQTAASLFRFTLHFRLLRACSQPSCKAPLRFCPPPQPTRILHSIEIRAATGQLAQHVWSGALRRHRRRQTCIQSQTNLPNESPPPLHTHNTCALCAPEPLRSWHHPIASEADWPKQSQRTASFRVLTYTTPCSFRDARLVNIWLRQGEPGAWQFVRPRWDLAGYEGDRVRIAPKCLPPTAQFCNRVYPCCLINSVLPAVVVDSNGFSDCGAE